MRRIMVYAIVALGGAVALSYLGSPKWTIWLWYGIMVVQAFRGWERVFKFIREIKRRRRERLEKELVLLQRTIDQCRLENQDMIRKLEDRYRAGGEASLVEYIRKNRRTINSSIARRNVIREKLCSS